MLEDTEWKEQRFESIAKGAGIGPRKLQRCRERGRVARLYIAWFRSRFGRCALFMCC